MHRSKLIYVLIVGLIAGFLIGFVFANATNRRELERARDEIGRLRSAAATNEARTEAASTQNPPPRLTDEEIRNALARADAEPNNIVLQRTLGRGLYLYARETGNTQLLPEAVRLLRRAYQLDSRDYETTVILGNALFEIGQTSDPSQFAEARRFYLRALETRPDDANVRTDLGLSYFYERPSDPRRAIEQYRRSLQINPRHEQALQNLTVALISTGEFGEAEETLAQLQTVNASNASLENLRAQLQRERAGARQVQN